MRETSKHANKKKKPKPRYKSDIERYMRRRDEMRDERERQIRKHTDRIKNEIKRERGGERKCITRRAAASMCNGKI